jgi:hypothetical protein
LIFFTVSHYHKCSDYSESIKNQKPRSKRSRVKAKDDGMDKGDLIIETSEDENTTSLAQPTMSSNTSEDTTLIEITSSTPPTNPDFI